MRYSGGKNRGEGEGVRWGEGEEVGGRGRRGGVLGGGEWVGGRSREVGCWAGEEGGWVESCERWGIGIGRGVGRGGAERVSWGWGKRGMKDGVCGEMGAREGRREGAELRGVVEEEGRGRSLEEGRGGGELLFDSSLKGTSPCRLQRPLVVLGGGGLREWF